MQYMYIIKCQQYHKIGVATDVSSRLAQLSTGNPYPLEVEIVYTFDNAEIIERVIHQRFKDSRVRGEWFTLNFEDKKLLHQLCLMLGGSASEYTGQKIDEDVIEEAEEIAEVSENEKWEFSQMFADGWQIEVFQGKRKLNGETVKTGHYYWQWGKWSNGKRQRVYGGTLASLPYPDLDTMRRVYRDGGQP